MPTRGRCSHRFPQIIVGRVSPSRDGRICFSLDDLGDRRPRKDTRVAMAITFHPKPGQILMCDFTTGFSAPEMVKKRPVLVLSKALRHRSGLVTVVPLSTTPPDPVCDYHYKLPKASLPMVGNFQQKDTWVKADMICTVAFHRLDLIRLGKRKEGGKRQYFDNCLGRSQMSVIYGCVLHGLGLSSIVEHL